jgi:AraC family transcriptional regulator of adaptative response / DNA-3-methyladenine glycosylase II
VIDYLARRAIPGVEELVGDSYRRSLALEHGYGVAEFSAANGYVRARYRLEDERDLDDAVARSRALFDLDRDPATVLEALGDAPLIAPSVRETPGRRVPGQVDAHEIAVRAVLGQQVSLSGAATLALAAALACGDVSIASGADPSRTRQALLELPGIGPWTADYVALRALGDPDAFLAGDLGVRRALESLGEDGSSRNALRIAESWRPFRGYALMHLWAMPSPVAGA